MSYRKLSKRKSCSTALRAGDKPAVLREILEALVQGGSLPEDQLDGAHAALIAREGLASTGVGLGVAIPHVQFARLSRERDFQSFALQARTRAERVDSLKEMSHA